MTERRVLQHGFHDADVRRVPLRGFRRHSNRMHDPSESDVGPDDRRLRMPLEECLHLREIDRLGVCLRKGHVDVVVKDHDEAGFSRKLQDAIEGGVGQARRLAGDLWRTRTLCGCVNSPIPVNTPGKILSTRRIWSTPYMSAGLKPVIIGSNLVRCSMGSDCYTEAM